jgi:hypothetical protein
MRELLAVLIGITMLGIMSQPSDVGKWAAKVVTAYEQARATK